MSQTTTKTLVNAAGATFRATLNTILGALWSNSAGTVAPTAVEAGQSWFDTALGVFKVRNAANTAWLGLLDASKNLSDLASKPTALVNLGITSTAADINTLLARTGAIEWYTHANVPTGRLKANGAAISRTTYADLFAAIGTTYGAGNGTTTFNLPDLRGEFPRGWDDARGVDGGRAIGTSQAAAMLNHTHTGTTSVNGDHNHGAVIPQYSGDADRGGNPSNFSIDTPNTLPTDGAHSHTMTTGNPSVGGGPETRPRNIALMACIVY
jgi:microcystin-dependent protein